MLDEPLAALDPLARADFMKAVREAVAADQISAVFSTHVVAVLEQVADYLIVLGRGAVLLSGPTAELTAARGGQSPERVILSALRKNAEHPQGQGPGGSEMTASGWAHPAPASRGARRERGGRFPGPGRSARVA